MLSARHHVCYWILSITAALVYQGLVTGLGFQEEIFRMALIPLMGLAIYILWNGPGHLPSEWHIHQQVATACLMVCLGSVSGHLDLSDASVEKVKPMFHTFLAFSTISALESIRQNRNDIQPGVIVGLGFDFEIGTKYWGWDGAFFHFYSYFFVLLLLCGIYYVLALALVIIYGSEVSKDTMNCIYTALSEISDTI
ncbi:hypothetical protein CEP54_004122 [Fusarium duplospermum]|uniref:Uncharacterized protein n=1 Tax=Fusarium duplospermum TaxID=1325734 RepID=A0A428QK54_9HYPO|nr:hypothetical protein CEP54_004122 [Fusarium duplospermum]